MTCLKRVYFSSKHIIHIPHKDFIKQYYFSYLKAKAEKYKTDYGENKIVCSREVVLKVLSSDLGQNYIHNNTKILFFLFTIILRSVEYARLNSEAE